MASPAVSIPVPRSIRFPDQERTPAPAVKLIPVVCVTPSRSSLSVKSQASYVSSSGTSHRNWFEGGHNAVCGRKIEGSIPLPNLLTRQNWENAHSQPSRSSPSFTSWKGTTASKEYASLYSESHCTRQQLCPLFHGHCLFPSFHCFQTVFYPRGNPELKEGQASIHLCLPVPFPSTNSCGECSHALTTAATNTLHAAYGSCNCTC